VNDTVVVDHENSLLDPEKAVGDDATTGELGALQVRLSVNYADGTTEYLFGTAGGYVTLASLDGADRSSTETIGAGEQATVTFWSGGSRRRPATRSRATAWSSTSTSCCDRLLDGGGGLVSNGLFDSAAFRPIELEFPF